MTFTELKTGRELNIIDSGAVFALGNFDGVHLGHRKVLERAISIADASKCESVAWCLSSPIAARNSELLSDEKEKMKLLRELGCDFAVFEDFEKVKNMSPSEFVSDYLAQSGCTCAVCGFNFRFGKGALADSKCLETLCLENGISSVTEQAVELGGAPVSSTRIRKCLKEGKIKEATELLSRPYSFCGIVKQGRHIGKSFGFPTVNLSFENGKLVPKHGVYFTRTQVGEKVYPSVSNVGSRPTVGGHITRLETHIIDFDEDLYGQEITVELEEFRRAEVRFSTDEELISAIRKDRDEAVKYFGI